jgi:hypothetical protein
MITPSHRAVQAAEPGRRFPQEGVYEIEVKASEGDRRASLTFILNLYRQRPGLFIDNPPSEVDLQLSPAPETKVRYAGATPATAFTWTTDISDSAVAMGDVLRLDAAVLRPGTRVVNVQAMLGSRPGPSTGFSLRVLGPMQMELSPPDAALTVRKGAPFALHARARDRDGSEMPSSSIRWSSHLAGPVASGGQLTAASIQNLAPGEHAITVTATNGSGLSISAVRRLRILPEARTAGIQVPGGAGNDGGGGNAGGEGGGFDDGQKVGGTSGGQLILGQGNLLQRFGIPK